MSCLMGPAARSRKWPDRSRSSSNACAWATGSPTDESRSASEGIRPGHSTGVFQAIADRKGGRNVLMVRHHDDALQHASHDLHVADHLDHGHPAISIEVGKGLVNDD